MIPPELANCLAFVGLSLSILLATTTWGRQKAERK